MPIRSEMKEKRNFTLRQKDKQTLYVRNYNLERQPVVMQTVSVFCTQTNRHKRQRDTQSRLDKRECVLYITNYNSQRRPLVREAVKKLFFFVAWFEAREKNPPKNVATKKKELFLKLEKKIPQKMSPLISRGEWP